MALAAPLSAFPVRAAAPRTAIVVLSGLSRKTNASVCIARGASGFVEKRDPLERLRAVVRAAADAGSGAELAR